jgi:hypothetical protein
VVRVEGREQSRTCLFETAKPERAARILLNRSPICWEPSLLRPTQGLLAAAQS